MVSPRWLLDGHSQGRTSHPMKNTSKAAVLAEVEAMSRPQLSLVETVDEETGEILTAKAFVAKPNETIIVSRSKRQVYPGKPFALVTNELLEQLLTTPNLTLVHYRVMTWLLLNADYENGTKVSVKGLVRQGIASRRTTIREVLDDLEGWQFIRTVALPANASRTVMVNPHLRWRGKPQSQRAAVDLWNDLAG